MTAEEIRNQLLKEIDQGWGRFVDRFQSLPEEQRRAYLNKQGYARLGDLLAHVIAWWELAIGDINQLSSELDKQIHWHYDVDGLNAQAVRRFSSFSNEEVAHVFQRTRSDLRWLVLSLPDISLEHPRIYKRLKMEIVNHLEENTLP